MINDNQKKIILIVSIDTECDKGANWEIQHPLKFRSVLEGIPNRLTPLFEKYDVKPTYLLSPEVIKDQECIQVLRSLKNCELGTHLHGEFIDSEETLINRTSTPQLSYEPDLEFEKLQSLTNLFKQAFGYDPKSFRAGRFGISHQTINFLERLGYKVDSSVAPFRKIKFDVDHEVNFWGAPYYPYFPSRKNITKKGKANVLEVPISTIIPLFANLPLIFQRIIGKNTARVKLILKKFISTESENDTLIYLRPLRDSSQDLINNANKIIHLWHHHYPPILNIMFHSVEVIEGSSPYVKNYEDVDTFFNSLDSLIHFLKFNYQLISLGLSEVFDFTVFGNKQDLSSYE